MLRADRALAVLLATGVAVAIASREGHAAAQAPSIDARTFRAPVDPGASMVGEPVGAPGRGEFHAAAWGSYAYAPVTGTDPATGARVRPVEHSAQTELVLGLGVGGRASVAASVPLAIYQRSDASRVPSALVAAGRVPVWGIGDLALHGKVAVRDNADGGLGLAVASTLTLPTGERASFLGEGAVTASARMVVDYNLLIAGAQASVGYRLRAAERTWDGERLGGEVPWAVALRVRPAVIARALDADDRQTWELAARGALGAGPTAPFERGRLTPALVSLSDRIGLGRRRDAFVVAGIDVGLGDAIGVPAVRGVLAVGWAPRAHDVDGDGVPDDVDQCVEIPEDKDGFEDQDGCPEIDDDGDGIVDEEDACPRVAGARSRVQGRNGCPAETPMSPADRDGDGVPDGADRCPDQAEDRDGFQDDDGCPDPDDDGDGVSDAADACPRLAGEPSVVPTQHGCPSPDRDGDTIPNEADACPDAAETWNGVTDEDGCPDTGGRALVVIEERAGRVAVRLARPIELVGGDDAPAVAPASMPLVRALATELTRHRDWTLAVGARPPAGAKTDRAQEKALVRAFAVVKEIAALGRRDGVAETVGWDAVKGEPGAASGIAFLVLVATVP